MVLARWQGTVVDDAGNVQDGASVTVRAETLGTPLASLFSDRDGLVATGNPITADADGFAAFHVAGGAYQITATKGSFSRTWRYVGIGTAAENDATAFQPANPFLDAFPLPNGSPNPSLGSDAAGWANLFLAEGGAVDFGSGDVAITHSANALTFAGASNGYSFDAAINGTPLSASVQSTGLNGIDGDQFFIFKNYTDAPGVGAHPSSEISVLRVQRHANYTGGTPGNVENAIWANHVVEADVANFEWSILGQLDNYATAGENVAVYASANKRSGAGPTWAATYAAQDFNTNPTSQIVGQEIGMFANGGDSNIARLGIDIVAGKRDTGGTTATIGRGLRIGPQNSDAANGIFIDGIYLSKTFTVGINMSDANCSTADIITKGSVLFGGLSAVPTTSGGTVTPTLAAAGIGSITGANYSADGNPTIFTLAKSRNATKGSHTVVQTGDTLGDIRFEGSDGTNFIRGAAIRASVEGTPGTNDMPVALQFFTTPDGSATPVERMRCDSRGNVAINTAAIATNATDGFLYVPTCAGTPTGTPTTLTGRAPIVVNTTNNKLYFYSGGAWRDAGP